MKGVFRHNSEPGNSRLSKDDGSMASKLPQISQVMACWVHFCFACLSCPSAPQVDKWFTTKPMETADGLVMTAIGNFCFWCGHTTEAWPLEVPETLAQRFHSNLAFRGTFTAIREKLQNMADFGTEFRNESVLTTNRLRHQCSVGPPSPQLPGGRCPPPS